MIPLPSRASLDRLSLAAPPVLIYGLIFWLSSIPGAALSLPTPDAVPHFIAYAVLAFFLARAFGPSPRAGWVWACMLAVFALGALDEFHQYFVPGRFFSLWDLAFDGAGAGAGTALNLRWRRLKGKTDAAAQ